ncbi:hypothetical protein [Sneathiella litorea]|uniref:Uncharacterized protein n=1 Tax=Sneathiella litorea TaxID=2606216 RepID=A0A6L8W986_9PROT|nr:hypothetical protein [Sneathiella litorea]MZR31681.1 hypothetical protein [Sneathiella litorea]
MAKTSTPMDEIRKNPAHYFKEPQNVVQDKNLTTEQQAEILKSWEDDTKALLRAETENMPAAERQAKPAELLSTISKLRAELKDSQTD